MPPLHLCYSCMSAHPWRHPPAKMNGGSGEKWISPPQFTRTTSLCSNDQCHQVLLRLRLSSVSKYIEILRSFMPYYNVISLAKENGIDKMPCGDEVLRTTAVRIWHQVSHGAAQICQLLSKCPSDAHRGIRCSRSLPQICTEVSAALEVSE